MKRINNEGGAILVLLTPPGGATVSRGKQTHVTHFPARLMYYKCPTKMSHKTVIKLKKELSKLSAPLHGKKAVLVER